MRKTRKGLGRGLSALIPDADMEFLSRVARGEDVARASAATRDSQPDGAVPATAAKRGSGRARTASQGLPRGSQLVPADGQQDTSAEKERSSAAIATEKIGSSSEQRSVDQPSSTPASLTELIPLAQIEANPYQPRRNFSIEEMEELVASVKEHGVLQPVLLRPVETDLAGDEAPSAGTTPRYQLVAGERRWRASQAAGIESIPAIIRRVSDQQALELAVIENVQRHDISALDAAIAYRRLVHEFSLSQEEVARRVGKSRAAIANTLRLLDLPQEVQKSIEEGAISEGHGRAILLAPGDGARRAVFRRVIREKLSVRSTEELARTVQESEEVKPSDTTDDEPPLPRQQPEVRRIEEGLQKHLGTRVKLRPRKRGGQMVIQYFSNEELERILKLLMR